MLKILFFFSVIFPPLMCIFKKMYSNLASESSSSDNNRKKLDENWAPPTFSQLNGWGYGWGLKCTIQFLQFDLTESIQMDSVFYA